MAGGELSVARLGRGDFVLKTQVLTAADVSRALTRIAHDIVERNHGFDDGLVVVGLQTGGVPFAQRISDILAEIGGQPIAFGSLDVALYRDDHSLRPVVPEAPTAIPVDVSGSTVVLVDDVLYTGRTVRAALGALADLGRPRAVQLATMIDRGHRELPIRPDYVGKNLPTSKEEIVLASLDGVWLGEAAPE